MRTNIEIDEALLTEVMQKTGAKTKREAVNRALQESLRHTKQIEALRALKGKIEWVGDLDEMRTDPPDSPWFS
jgi:Arc/MetJ family transcription regulator